MSWMSPSNKGGLRGGFRLQTEDSVANQLENSLACASPSKKRFHGDAGSPQKSVVESVPGNRSPAKDYIRLSLNQQLGGTAVAEENTLLDDLTTNVQRILSENIDFIPAINPHNVLLLNIQKNCHDVSTIRVKTPHKFQCGSKKAGMLTGGDVHRPYDPLNKSPVRDGNLKPQLPLAASSSPVSPTKKIFTEDQLPEPKKNFYDEKNVRPEWQTPEGTGAGLFNVGNTCFLNATLQCLAYTPALQNYLTGDGHQNCRLQGYCIICELKKLLPQMVRCRNGQPLRPFGIYSNIKVFAKTLSIGRQEDAHEFLRFVVEAMRKTALITTGEDVKKLDLFTQETTFASRIFGGFYRSRVLCQVCKYPSNVYDPFLDIPLDIAKVSRLEEALRAFTRLEHLNSPNNLYHCDRCKKSCPATKQVTIHKAPTVLTFQLKRFLFNSFSSFSKIDKPIEFPETLNLRAFMSPGESTDDVMYKLYAVLVHSGSSCHSGHYYSFVRSGNDVWSRMDDTQVSMSGKQTVLNQRAYLLFYTRLNSTQSAALTHLNKNGGPPRGPIGPRVNPLQVHQNTNGKDLFFAANNPAAAVASCGTAQSSPVNGNRLIGPAVRNGLPNQTTVKTSPMPTPLATQSNKVTIQFVPRTITVNNGLNGVKFNGIPPKKPVVPVTPVALVPYADEDDDDTVTGPAHPEPSSRGSSTSSNDSVKENKGIPVVLSPKKTVGTLFQDLTHADDPARLALAKNGETVTTVNGSTPSATPQTPLVTLTNPVATAPSESLPVLSKKAMKKLKKKQMQAEMLASRVGTVATQADLVPQLEATESPKKKKKKKHKKRRRNVSSDESGTRSPVWVEKDAALKDSDTQLNGDKKTVRDTEPEPRSLSNVRPSNGTFSPRRPEILSWSGGKSLLDQADNSDSLERRKRQFEETDSYDESLDSGRTKKSKPHNFAHSGYRNGGSGNAFQRYQDYRTDGDSRSKSVANSRSSYSDSHRRPYRSP